MSTPRRAVPEGSRSAAALAALRLPGSTGHLGPLSHPKSTTVVTRAAQAEILDRYGWTAEKIDKQYQRGV